MPESTRSKYSSLILLMCVLGCGSPTDSRQPPKNPTNTVSDIKTGNDVATKSQSSRADIRQPAAGVEDRIQGDLSLDIVVGKDESGARVIIADEQNEFGGRLLSSLETIDAQPAAEWLQRTLATLTKFKNVTVLPRSTVFGYYDQNFLTIAERCTDHLGEHQHDQVRERLWRVRAKQVVLAQGAFERPLVFCNNDRPGVMLASAVSSYVNRYAVCSGQRVVVFTNNDSAYQTAIDLRHAGVVVAAIVDSRAKGAAAL
ncbi:MAG: hypothetical protein IH991_21265, partial [Planctomycetes bacterium]|nr:hypothetical protein [Planctomycetota bacterium]